MARRKKDTPIQVSVKYFGSGVAQCVGLMAIERFQKPEYMKVFQKWKAEQERGDKK